MENPVITGFFWSLKSLPLDRGGRLGRDVVANTVNPRDLVDDTGGNTVQHVVGDAGPVGGHEIAGSHRAEGQGIVVGAPVAHNAHRAGIGQNGKVLVDVLILARGGDLLPVDGVGLPEGVGLLLGDVPNDPDGQSPAPGTAAGRPDTRAGPAPGPAAAPHP